jgi:hypothetical protein
MLRVGVLVFFSDFILYINQILKKPAQLSALSSPTRDTALMV